MLVSADAFDALRRRDEILQVMFWMRGEKLGEIVGAPDLQAFLGDETLVIEDDLAALVDAGMLEPAGADGGRFRLTRRGIDEGGRRFVDEFAELQHPGHGACDRPGCVCLQFGPEACVAFAGQPA